MIYFDNAATSRIKPEVVYDAFMNYMKEVGVSPGRGSYSLGIKASRMLYQSRKSVTDFFGNPNKTNVVFTKNSTEAINLFLNGFLKKGDHVLVSCFEHNAVLRPIHTLKEMGIIDYTVLSQEVLDNPEIEIPKYIKKNTRLLTVTLASNLTGQLVYSKTIGKICKENGMTVFVDASQGAGKRIIDMNRDYVDYLAFTGHKDLLAMPGVGGLCSQSVLDFPPLIQGGTGIHGEEYVNPHIYPEGYESGTLNMPAIWSLKVAIDFIKDHREEIVKKENELTKLLIDEMILLPNVIVYNSARPRVSTVCFNVKDVPSSNVVAYLDKNGICVRGGIHCAILAHETLGTVGTGAVRVSLNCFNTKDEVARFIDVLRRIK